jgi:hypothetical protein
MSAALCDDGALTTHLLCAHLTLSAGSATFAVGMKEHCRIDTSAQAGHLPIPDVGIWSG